MDTAVIITANGKPYARPEKPAPDANIEEKIAYMRAVYAYNDAIAADAGRAFASAFGKALR